MVDRKLLAVRIAYVYNNMWKCEASNLTLALSAGVLFIPGRIYIHL